MRVIKILAYNALFFAFLLCLVEIFSFTVLKISGGHQQNLFINREEGVVLPEDSLLGWTHNPNSIKIENKAYKYGCVITRTRNLSTAPPFRILVTGGSTSDETLFPFNWPVHLHSLLEEKGISVELYNSAVAGYGSNQELLNVKYRLIDSIKPNLVLTYSGVNENVGFYKIGKAVYFGGTYQINRILPNTFGLFYHQIPFRYELNYNRLTPEELSTNWLDNVASIEKLSADHNSYFLAFLQPALGVGDYKKNGSESLIDPIPYYNKFCSIVREKIEHEDHIIDLTGVLDSVSNVYLDDCHLNEHGNEVIALAIRDMLLTRGIFPSDETSSID